ncbi:MAG: RHS repeat-associated core domain-containing protein, partial [Hydrogenophaga sp.]|nr:RHS repeat-associated core domain-containing protein [Hydrogenophaga sp.]
SAVLGKVLPFCKDKSVGCGTYLKNASKFYLNQYVVEGLYHPKYKNLRMIVGWGTVLGLFYWMVYRQVTGGFGNVYRFASPLLLTSILFTFTSGCGIFTKGSQKGDAPWLLLAGGINSNTPTVKDDGMTVSGGGGGIPFTVPVTGMYFVHSDHLGSVSFLTNGRGALVAGGEFGGKSDIQYKPYGEIDRPHSSGPDISKYKYTGQEEDKESGLLYYKARYYDPGLGRFLQADDILFPSRTSGMNRMMYVEGNPVLFNDPSGHCANACSDNDLMLLVYFGLLAQGKATLAMHPPGHVYSGSGNWDYKFLNNCIIKTGIKELKDIMLCFMWLIF